MATFSNWQRRLLRALGAPVTEANLAFLNAWQRAEGGTARYNPLNTTQTWAGATAYNSVGVRNYPNARAGIQATVKTLLNGHYAAIVNGLKSGASAADLARAVEASPWGTHSIPIEGGAAPTAPPGAAPAAPAAGGPSVRQEGAHAILGLLASGTYSASAGLHALLAVRQSRGSLQSAGSPGPARVRVEGGDGTALDAKVVRLAQKYLGTPYVWGGENPGGFDCSGLLQYVWGRNGVEIPRTSQLQWHAGKAVTGKLRPGDAVFFGSPKGPHHVGMYIGNGKFIESPRTGLTVRISRLKGRSDYIGARRFA